MTSARRERALPYLLFALSFASFQAYRLFASSMGLLEGYAAYGLLYASLLFLYYVFVVRIEDSRPSRYGFITFGRRATLAAAALAGLLVGVYTVVTLEPGFIYGFVVAAKPSDFAFGFFLFTAPLVALTEEAIYRGYIFKKLAATGPLSSALLVSSGLYALQLTNPLAFEGAKMTAAAQQLLLSVVTPFVLGVVMCLYFYKSGWSLLGPVIVRAGILLETNLSPLLAKTPGFEFSFIFDLLGSAALIILVNLLVREPRFMARRYLDLPTSPKVGRFRQRARNKADARRTLLQVSIIGVVVVSAFVGLQYVSSSRIHLSAIATGSMRPTLPIGSLVVVESVSSPSMIQVGDIVEYNPPTLRGPIVHRVINIDETSSGPIFTTKGDDNPSQDPVPFGFDRVIGKVVLAIPLVGYLVLSPPLAVALIIFLFLCSIFSSSFKRRGRGGRR